jgi:hypothetical protein
MAFAVAKEMGDAHEIVAAKTPLMRKLSICCSSGAYRATRFSNCNLVEQETNARGHE